MAVSIEAPTGRLAMREFLALADRVNERRPLHWPAFTQFELAVLSAGSPYLAGRHVQPLLARQGGLPVARVLAVVDERYNHHWGEELGHLAMFEALPGTAQATRALFDAACEWLAERGLKAARCGYGILDLPFAIDAYDELPPTILRQNPPYYHALLKGARFASEKGWLDYRIDVTPAITARWTEAVRAARRAGYEIVPLRDLRRSVRAMEMAETWNDAFARHWGHTPTSTDEFLFLIDSLKSSGVLDTSVIGYRDGEPLGAVWAVPESGSGARCLPGRTLTKHERLNVLAIGVREPARGTGLNLALAGYAFLELARRGAEAVSYTLVLDDNWPSRRTAEKLGAEVRANYVTYRRELR
jgi:Acetyltransferase (GNAT) family